MRKPVCLILAVFLPVALAPLRGQIVFSYDLPGKLVSQAPAAGGPPVILRQPAMQVVSAGNSGSFSVIAADTTGVNYQWWFNDSAIAGATTEALLLTNVTAASQGNYSVVLANNSGSVTSAPAMLFWDSVGDGLPDSWKLEYFGSVSNATASGDPLNDGVSNLEKFLEGTNPTNGAGLYPRLFVNCLNGAIQVSPDVDKFTLGQTATLTAVPLPGFQFVTWSGDLSGTNNPAPLTMDNTKNVTAVCGLPLGYALNAPALDWRSGGDLPWYGQNYVTYAGVAAAQSGPIATNQTSWLETTVVMDSPGTIGFWYKIVSSSSSVVFSVNGAAQNFFFSSDWQQFVAYLPAGSSVLRWTYQKIAPEDQGFDAAWLAQVTATVYTDPLYDSDFDGLPDLWEYRYFGTLAYSGTDDPDNDKVNNHDEYLDGTDPTDPTSVFPRLSVAASGGMVDVAPPLAKFAYLQQVTLTAVPNPGFTFSGWTGDLVAATNPATVTLDRSQSVRALFVMSSANSLAESLDATNLTWSTGGDAPWVAQSYITHDGVDAAQSGTVAGPSQQSWIQTTVLGPGPLSFWWKVSSAYFSDFLEFSIDSVVQTNISGNVDWQPLSFNLPAGPHVLQWTYTNSPFGGSASEAGWVDQVCFGASVPTLVTVLTNQTVFQGSNVVFAVNATSEDPLSYQWLKNGSNLTDSAVITGSRTASLTFSNPQTNDTATYTVLVSTPAGAASAAATLTVIGLDSLAQALDTPSWSWNSGGDALWLGQMAITHDGAAAGQSGALPNGGQSWIETTVTGPGILSFWWKTSNFPGQDYFNFLIDGVTNASLSGEVDWVPRSFFIPPGAHTVQWNYVQAIFALGAFTQEAAWLDQVALVPGTPPSIIAQPQPQTLVPGSTVSFSVGAAGDAPLQYQWFFDGTNILGANGATLTLTGVQAASAGYYGVLVSNNVGWAASSTALLNTNLVPTIFSQPAGQTVTNAATVTFAVVATGISLQYQWQLNGADLPGATASSLVLMNIQSGNAGSYDVVVSNSLGSVTSSNAQLIIGTPPQIVVQPSNQAAQLGSSVTFSVIATGSPLYYQWQMDGADLAGDTDAMLVLAGVQPADAGSYAVVVSNGLASVTSVSAQLLVGIGPTILIQPTSQTANPGSFAFFAVGASGSSPLAYQWQKDGANLVDATNSLLLFTSVLPSDAGAYDAVITNFIGSVTSSVAVLTVTGTVTNAAPFLSISSSGSLVTILWTAIPGRTYQVQSNYELSSATWSNLPPAIIATSSQASISNNIGHTTLFYRVVLLP